MEGVSVWFMVIKSLGMLALVLGSLVGTLHLMKKFMPVGGKTGEKSMIRMLSAFYLTPKERVVLLEVMGRRILIGVTPQGITRIAEFDGAGLEEPEQAPIQENNFANLLSRMTGRLTLVGDKSKSQSETPLV